MKRIVITTGDGSKTLAIRSDGETYHSRHGAINESKHVFIANGLESLAGHKKEIRILEVGFGTGLNALLTYRFAKERGVHIFYHGLEPKPLIRNEWEALDYAAEDEAGTFEVMHALQADQTTQVAPFFDLLRTERGLMETTFTSGSVDLIYYDAFGPNTQPELWTPACFTHCFSALTAGGSLVTYCAKGQVRRDLQGVGFDVERLEGPPGKREMLRAWKR